MQNQFQDQMQSQGQMQNQNQMQNVVSNKQHLSGVKCVVSNCSYHAAGDHCTASSIEIQHRQASQSHETDCATFEAK